MNTDSLKTFVRSRLFVGIVVGIGIMLVVFCIFELGVVVGYHEATFSSRWGENYERNFGAQNDLPGSLGMPDGHQPNSHGIDGKILSVASSTLVIDNDEGPEQKILLSNDTIIRDQEKTITASDLTVGEYAIIVGSPDNQGQIDAKLIRILPAPPTVPSPTTP